MRKPDATRKKKERSRCGAVFWLTKQESNLLQSALQADALELPSVAGGRLRLARMRDWKERWTGSRGVIPAAVTVLPRHFPSRSVTAAAVHATRTNTAPPPIKPPPPRCPSFHERAT